MILYSYIFSMFSRFCYVFLNICFCSVSYYYYVTPNFSRVTYCYSTFLFHYYYSSTHFCPLDFSEMPWSNFMKPCRNIICHVKLCFKGLIFSKWLPLPWKWPKCLKIEKHKNDHSRLLAKQKLMKLDRNNIHI